MKLQQLFESDTQNSDRLIIWLEDDLYPISDIPNTISDEQFTNLLQMSFTTTEIEELEMAGVYRASGMFEPSQMGYENLEPLHTWKQFAQLAKSKLDDFSE